MHKYIILVQLPAPAAVVSNDNLPPEGFFLHKIALPYFYYLLVLVAINYECKQIKEIKSKTYILVATLNARWRTYAATKCPINKNFAQYYSRHSADDEDGADEGFRGRRRTITSKAIYNLCIVKNIIKFL